MLINPLLQKKVGVSSYPASHDDRTIHAIKGQVLEHGNSISASVHLYSKQTNQLVNVTQTNENGFYVFNSLKKTGKFFIVSHHPKNKYNAVIQDNVVPK